LKTAAKNKIKCMRTMTTAVHVQVVEIQAYSLEKAIKCSFTWSISIHESIIRIEESQFTTKNLAGLE
jgi:hypothetical protein